MFQALMKEPLVYFVLLGGLLVWATIPSVTEEELTASTIELPRGFVSDQKAQFQQQYHRLPTDAELDGLLEQAVNDEILFREAWRLQLFVGDDVVRKRMIQKMRFVLEKSPLPPTVAESLVDERMATEPSTFETTRYFDLYHVVFKDAQHAQDYLDAIGADPSVSVSEMAGKVAFPLGNVFPHMSTGASSQVFGAAFSEQLVMEETGRWQGPVKSRYGYHAVKLSNFTTRETQDDTRTRDRIRQEITRQHIREQRQHAIEAIKERYVIAHAE